MDQDHSIVIDEDLSSSPKESGIIVDRFSQEFNPSSTWSTNSTKLNQVSDEPQSKRCPQMAATGRATRNPAKRPKIDQCMEFFASELSKATRSFNRSTVVGRGGYGTVYKGELRHQTVAIKVLTQEGSTALAGGCSQLQTEMAALNRFRHPHVLQMLGYCVKPSAMVFEYMENGSLFEKLHKVNRLASLVVCYPPIGQGS